MQVLPHQSVVWWVTGCVVVIIWVYVCEDEWMCVFTAKMCWVRKCTDLPMFSLPFLIAVTHEQLKERSLFGLPPPPGTNPADYYHLMANHRSPYGELLMQTGAAAAAAAVHLPDYISPVDSVYILLWFLNASHVVHRNDTGVKEIRK